MRPPMDRPTRWSSARLEVLGDAQHVPGEIVELQRALVVLGIAVAARVPGRGLEAVREKNSSCRVQLRRLPRMPCRKSTRVPLPATETARRGAGSTRIVSRLLRLRARDLDGAAAALAVLPDVGGEFLGRAADHVVALCRSAASGGIRLLEDLPSCPGRCAGRPARRARRQEEAEPGVRLDFGIAQLGEGRHLGSSGERFAPPIAIALMRPALSCGIEVAMPAKVSCTSPAITAGTASEIPL